MPLLCNTHVQLQQVSSVSDSVRGHPQPPVIRCSMCQVRGQPECYVAREQLPALQQMSVQESWSLECAVSVSGEQ